jgi:hypothetical protein
LNANLIYWNHLGYVEKRTNRRLNKAWIGFKIAKKEGEHDKMKYYAESIQKFEKQLRLPVYTFSDVIKQNVLGGAIRKEEDSAATNEL